MRYPFSIIYVTRWRDPNPVVNRIRPVLHTLLDHQVHTVLLSMAVSLLAQLIHNTQTHGRFQRSYPFQFHITPTFDFLVFKERKGVNHDGLDSILLAILKNILHPDTELLLTRFHTRLHSIRHIILVYT